MPVMSPSLHTSHTIPKCVQPAKHREIKISCVPNPEASYENVGLVLYFIIQPEDTDHRDLNVLYKPQAEAN